MMPALSVPQRQEHADTSRLYGIQLHPHPGRLDDAEEPTDSGFSPTSLPLSPNPKLLTHRGPGEPLRGPHECAARPTEVQETGTYWVAGLLQKDMTPEPPDGREAQGEVGDGPRGLRALS